MWSTGSGSEVMKRIAAPMIGGVVTSAVLELLLYPVIYVLWRGRGMRRVEAHLESESISEKVSDLYPADSPARGEDCPARPISAGLLRAAMRCRKTS